MLDLTGQKHVKLLTWGCDEVLNSICTDQKLDAMLEKFNVSSEITQNR